MTEKYYVLTDLIKMIDRLISALPTSFYNGIMAVRGELNTAPAADVRPVVRGTWIKLDMHKGMEQYKCSVCNSECYVPTCMGEPMYGFCPNCGAGMREAEP